MANENHMANAGRKIAKGVNNAVNNASQGDLTNAAQAAWEGTVESAQEVGESLNKSAQFLTDRQRNQE